MNEFKDFLMSMAKPTGAFVLIICMVILVKSLLDHHLNDSSQHRVYRQLIMGSVIIFCILLFVFFLPNEQNLRGQVVGLLGILISGALAFSSTTFLGNALAGIMLRSVKSYRPGNFISVNGHRGRVSESGLFHTEIQSDDRDLTTLPNLFLATNPVKVTNSKGTIIKTQVSLGYDEPRLKVESLLLDAAKKAELSDPFVQIIELGDFSVIYRINGLLTDSSRFLSVQSRLNAKVLDTLHEGDVEIVSPTFMNTRDVNNKQFIATTTPMGSKVDQNHPEPESVIFDKALQAEILEDQKVEMAEIYEECEALKEKIKKCEDKAQKLSLEELLIKRQKRAEKLKRRISRMTVRIEDGK